MKFLIVITYYSGTGYIPAPFSTNALISNNNNEGGNSQNDTLFSRGNQFYISNFLPIWTMSSSYYYINII